MPLKKGLAGSIKGNHCCYHVFLRVMHLVQLVLKCGICLLSYSLFFGKFFSFFDKFLLKFCDLFKILGQLFLRL